MSADNGIYILETKGPEFRVIEAQAIDNLYWWWGDERLYDDEWVEQQKASGVLNPFKDKGEHRSEINPIELKRYFGNCDVLTTKEEAMTVAQKIYDEIAESDFPVLEHGISFISGWEDKVFPK